MSTRDNRGAFQGRITIAPQELPELRRGLTITYRHDQIPKSNEIIYIGKTRGRMWTVRRFSDPGVGQPYSSHIIDVPSVSPASYGQRDASATSNWNGVPLLKLTFITLVAALMTFSLISLTSRMHSGYQIRPPDPTISGIHQASSRLETPSSYPLRVDLPIVKNITDMAHQWVQILTSSSLYMHAPWRVSPLPRLSSASADEDTTDDCQEDLYLSSTLNEMDGITKLGEEIRMICGLWEAEAGTLHVTRLGLVKFPDWDNRTRRHSLFFKNTARLCNGITSGLEGYDVYVKDRLLILAAADFFQNQVLSWAIEVLGVPCIPTEGEETFFENDNLCSGPRKNWWKVYDTLKEAKWILSHPGLPTERDIEKSREIFKSIKVRLSRLIDIFISFDAGMEHFLAQLSFKEGNRNTQDGERGLDYDWSRKWGLWKQTNPRGELPGYHAKEEEWFTQGDHDGEVFFDLGRAAAALQDHLKTLEKFQEDYDLLIERLQKLTAMIENTFSISDERCIAWMTHRHADDGQHQQEGGAEWVLPSMETLRDGLIEARRILAQAFCQIDLVIEARGYLRDGGFYGSEWREECWR